MRDSRLIQAMTDISDVARAKLGKEWAMVLLPFLLDECGFTMARMSMYDGEMIEFMATKIQTTVKDTEEVQNAD